MVWHFSFYHNAPFGMLRTNSSLIYFALFLFCPLYSILTIRERYREITEFNTRIYKSRWPGAIIIGISKCGTRAVLNYLSIHPAVSCGTLQHPLPEINYFNLNYDKGEQWYRKRMPRSLPGQLTIEKSPRYFVTEGVPERIKAFDKSIKLIVIVCDPLYRFVSQVLQDMDHDEAQGREFRPLADRAMDWSTQELRNSTGLRNGCYFRDLARWYGVFPSRQILMVDGDGLRKDPYTEMIKVESFLGIQPFFTPSHFHYNETKGFFCPMLDGELYCLAKNKGRPHPRMSPFVREKLVEHYAKCNRPFYDLVDRKFHWFY